mgnify:FL=1
MKKLKELMPYIIIVVVVLLVRSFIVTPGLVNGSSMEPTLYNNELVLINKIGLNKGIDRYDIVVVKYENSTIIKRVIGLPYETVEYINDTLYIDGEIVNTKVDFEYTKDFKLTAGKNEYIVLGDNRNISKDSRIIGPVKERDIIGKVDLVLFPFSKFGKVKWGNIMIGNYKIVTLCGSTKFKKEFLKIQKKLTLLGYIVISVGLFGHSGDNEVWENMDEGTLTKTKSMLDDMHKRKIDLSDMIYVINVGGYIGESTRSEIEYAISTGKEVHYLESVNTLKR